MDDLLVSEVDVMLSETGSGFRVSLADWEDWLNGEWSESCHHPIEHEALLAVLPLLQTKLPTANSVITAAGMKTDNESPTASKGGMVARISYEIAYQKLAERAARKGVPCPGCGTFSTDYQYMRVEMVSEDGPQSHLICRRCGKEFGPMDV